MKDIVTQLRTNSECLAPSIMLAAADEIERLRVERDEAEPLLQELWDRRTEVTEMRVEIERLRAERDEARRKCCEAWADGHEEFANNSGECGGEPWTPQRFAKEEGWDCFKENTND